MAFPLVVLVALCSFVLVEAQGEIAYVNSTLPTELEQKPVEIESTSDKVNVMQRKFNTSGGVPQINCSRGSISSGGDFEWTRGNGSHIAFEDDGVVKERVPPSGTLDRNTVVSVLKFPKFGSKAGSNVGQYKCSIDTYDSFPVVFSAPVVKVSEKDYRSVMEGDRLTQSCTVVAYPSPEIVWKKNNQIVVADGSRIKFSSDNRTMVIEELKKDDAGVYVCSANNTLGVGEAYIKLRVKDRWAALWPFLGIVAEVIVLVTIILLYEKKRAAQKRNQEEDTTEIKEDRNANDSDVRHRPVKT